MTGSSSRYAEAQRNLSKLEE